MTSAHVISVNAGRGKDAAWAGRLRRTAIDKRPVAGPVEVGWLGLAGDEQSDTENHGGREQALYAYAREDMDWWVERLSRPGAYLRVLQEGVIRAGDGVEVLSRPAERVTLAESMTAFYGDVELMRRLLRVEGRGTKWDEIAVGMLGRAVLARGSAVPGI
jgi:MOSC domain-containing protein YiiM